MEKHAIGFKVEYGLPLVILMFIGGVALIPCAILFFIYVIGGAIGGGIAGAMIFMGGFLISYGIGSKTLPRELVHIDAESVYLPKTTISFSQILNVTTKGKTLTIVPKTGKKITQGLIKNSFECEQQILEAMQSQNTAKNQ